MKVINNLLVIKGNIPWIYCVIEMKVLILGGTHFLGRHFVEQALSLGFEVTIFNRGKSNKNLFPEIEKLVGDRNGIA